MTSKKDTLFNYFGEQQTAHVYAYYKGGEFYDYYTHEKVTLDEGRHNEPFDKNNPSGILVKIKVPLNRTIDRDYERHQNQEKRDLLPVGTHLEFLMPYRTREQNIEYVIKVQILEDLKMFKKGNKTWGLGNCSCVVTSAREMYGQDHVLSKEIKADSLNQLYTKTSILLRPENASHNCNTFKTFYNAENGIRLDTLRNEHD